MLAAVNHKVKFSMDMLAMFTILCASMLNFEGTDGVDENL